MQYSCYALISLFLLSAAKITCAQEPNSNTSGATNIPDKAQPLIVVRFSSKSNPELIPPSIYYKRIFKDLLDDESSLARLTSTDRSLISNLPSHQDKQFDSVNFGEIMEVCGHVKSIDKNADISQQVIEAAEEFEASRLRSERDLADHYAAVIDQLSVSTKELLKQKKENLFTTGEIAYSYVDVIAMAKTRPEQILNTFESKCRSMADYRATLPEGSYKLKDEQTQRYPILSK